MSNSSRIGKATNELDKA